MLLELAKTLRPATNVGFLLHKNRRPLRVAPPRQHALDLLADLIACLPAFSAAPQEFVVAGLHVPHVRGDRQLHRVLAETLGGRRAAHAPTVFPARLRGDTLGAIRRTGREDLLNAFRKAGHERRIELGSPSRRAVAPIRARCGVTQALGLGALKRTFRNQQPLPLVPLAGTTPFEHHGGQLRVRAGASRERRIARGQEHEVFEIRTGEAEGAAIPGQQNPRPLAELFTTLVAARLPSGDEDT